ncbi:MAG TPA: ATP-binding protein [Anaeromyxobacter sp.]|nr:ATP-binding protein [Anaeromyxobacter sp.]
MERAAAPQPGFCEHRSTGRNCPISKTPCLGECIYASILEDIQLGIIGVDRSRKEIFFQNKLACELFGKTIRPRDYEALSSLLFADVADGDAKSVARKIRFGTRFLGCTVYRISDAYFWIYVSDITDKERLAAVAEAVNTMNNLGYVTSGIRHELGNPINSIKTAAMVLRENVHAYSPDVVAEFLDRVLSDVARVEKLLRNLKSFTPYEAPEARDVEMRAFLDSFLSIVTTDFAERSIRLRTFVRPDAEWGHLDPRALQQVMINVLTNAIDAVRDRPRPEVVIGVARSGDRLLLTIRDNGCGIPDEFKHHLFKPFFTTKQHGTGLGLVIMKSMMAKMAGTIELDSREDAGTTVTLDLPAGRPPAARPAGAPAPARCEPT